MHDEALSSLLRREFGPPGGLIYLNHAGVSPWPLRAADAVKRFADENFAPGPVHYERWNATEHALRDQFRELVNAESPDDVALLKNTSEGLSAVAYGLPWRAGDNVVITDQEFPSNRIVWESLRPQGVELREAAIGAGAAPEDALFALADDRTRVVAVSSVQYASGLRMDLGRIGDFCRGRGILFCVDAIQSLGALRMDVRADGADFVVADGHKWMMGPEGVALFYSRPEARDRLRLTQYGWHMVEAAGEYERREWTIARSARRFECGSPNMLGIHGLQASLSLALELGTDRVESIIINKTRLLIDKINEIDELELLSPADPARRSGIVTFRRKGMDSGALYRTLRARNVHAACRGGGIRFSPHISTPDEALEAALEAVMEA